MWAAMLHLVFGNAVIGAWEGCALSRLFKLPFARTAGVLVLANYFSAWVGYYAMVTLAPSTLPELFGGQPLYQASFVLWTIGISSYLASIVLELPFCWFCLPKGERSWGRTLLASLVVQTISYGVLVPYYLAASPTSLVSKTEHDASLSFARKERAWVYFITPDGGDVFRIRPDGSNRQFVLAAGITNQFHRLFLVPAMGEPAWNLCLVTERGSLSEGNASRILLERVARKTREVRIPDFIEDSRFSFGHPMDYRAASETSWKIWLGYWAAEGLHATSSSGDERRSFAFEAPFVLNWYARNATVLPSGLVIYQLGEQIVALDVEHRKVGFVTLGRGPVVVLEED